MTLSNLFFTNTTGPRPSMQLSRHSYEPNTFKPKTGASTKTMRGNTKAPPNHIKAPTLHFKKQTAPHESAIVGSTSQKEQNTNVFD